MTNSLLGVGIGIATLIVLTLRLLACYFDRRLNTETARAESALQKAYDELEIRVEKHTTELRNANERLQSEIVERRHAEEELRKSEVRNRALVNAIPDLILRISKDGIYLDFKQAKDFDMLVPDSELIGKSEYELLPPALAQQRMHYVERALSTCKIQIFEYQLLLNGNIRDEEARIVVSGEDEVLAIIRDITDRKQAEEALRESQQMLQSVMDNIPQFIFWKDRNSVFLGCNRNFAQAAGVGSPENIVGKTDYDLPWKKEEANFFRECDRRVMKTDTPEYHIIETLLQANGKQSWLDTNKVPLHDSRGSVIGILGTFEDITDRKQAEEALRDAHQRLAFHVENSPLAVVEWDREMRVLGWSPQAEKVFGWKAKEVLGLCFCDWQFIFAEDEAVGDGVIASLLSGREQRNVTSNRNYTKDGSVVHCEWYNSVLLDNSGSVVSVQSLALDVTARKRAESALQKAHDELEIRVEQRTNELRNANEQLQSEIVERQRVEEEIKKLVGDLKFRTVELEAANKELEAFSYSVSHDLRAPLRAINGFSRILLNEYAPQLAPEARRYLHLVQDNAQQMGCLVDDLLAFSRLGRSPLKPQPVTPTELVRQALTNLRHEQQSRHVEILVGDLPGCQADPSLLKQVWVNLLANALKFTRQQEVARIEVGCQQIDGKHVYFVKDNGVGFDMQYVHKLFGVFHRLHRAEEYEGTGVGLAIVQRVIHRHNGRVWVEAEVNKGATFYFTLGEDIHHDRDRSRNLVSGRQPQRRGIDTPLFEKQ